MSDGEPQEAKKMGLGSKLLLGFIGLVVVASIFGDDDEAAPASRSTAAQSLASTDTAIAEPVDNLTGPQRNAKRAAQDYLDFKGFSRTGLIEQLSSEYGSGFAVADATAAVDSMNIDWNEQAVRAARSYLELKGFSCNGLIEQMSSEHGSGFTREQASHGAQQAGAC